MNNYIDDFTELVIVFNNLKRTEVKRKDVVKLNLEGINRDLIYDSTTDTFKYIYNVNKFIIAFRGRPEDIKMMGTNKIVFKGKDGLIGEMKLKSSIQPSYEGGVVTIRSGL